LFVSPNKHTELPPKSEKLKKTATASLDGDKALDHLAASGSAFTALLRAGGHLSIGLEFVAFGRAGIAGLGVGFTGHRHQSGSPRNYLGAQPTEILTTRQQSSTGGMCCMPLGQVTQTVVERRIAGRLTTLASFQTILLQLVQRRTRFCCRTDLLP
jgi:hypothetical protein